MFDVPADAMYVWIGVGVVGLAAFGVVVGLPGAAPPDAVSVARAVDAVSAAPPGSTTTVDLTANRIDLGRSQIGLSGPGGRSHATFAFGPVAAAAGNPCIDRLLAGERPSAAFDSYREFKLCVLVATLPFPGWRPAPDRLRIRHVQWGEIDVTVAG